MDDVAFRRGQQARSIVSEIVKVGAGGYSVRRQLANALIEVRLAKVTAIGRIVAIASVVELPSACDNQMPAFRVGEGANTPGGEGRHSRRDRVDHANLGFPMAMSEGRQCEAVHPATHRNGESFVAGDCLGEPLVALDRTHSKVPPSVSRFSRRRASRLSPTRSSFSTFAEISPSGRRTVLTPTGRPSDSLVELCLDKVILISSRMRRPIVDVSKKQRSITIGAASGRIRRRNESILLPFLSDLQPIDRSRTPARFLRRSAATAISSPLMSSISKLISANTSARSTLGMPGSVRVPAPAPIAFIRPET